MSHLSQLFTGVVSTIVILSGCAPEARQENQVLKAAPSATQDDAYFFSHDVKEAEFTVQAYTFFGKSKGKPSEDVMKNDIAGKVRYMMGKMRRSAPSISAMYPKYSTKILSVTETDSQFRVDYEVSGKGVFKPNLTNYDFYIPIMASTLHSKANGRCSEAVPELVGESNFWYLWEPTLSSCPLKKNVDYVKVNSQLRFLPSTTLTFPEYDRLVKNGNILITVIHGLTDYNLPQKPPQKSDDFTAGMYLKQRKTLIDQGFTARAWSESEIRQFYNPSSARLPFVEDFVLKAKLGTVTVRMFFGNTNLEYDSAGYHAFLKKTLMESGVFIYNGHSGLGRNMNLSSIEALRGYKYALSPDYQIYSFGSFIPYSYYPDLFFKMKANVNDPQGTKNLDIFTFGDEAFVDNTNAYYLVNAVVQYAQSGAKKSYQQILKGTQFYLSILGDEDNPQQF